MSKRKTNWIGQTLRRNCLLRQVTEGNVEGWIEVTGRQRRRRRKLLHDLKGKEKILLSEGGSFDCTMWRVVFGRGFGNVVRETNK
jgi:hypothetical protein